MKRKWSILEEDHELSRSWKEAPHDKVTIELTEEQRHALKQVFSKGVASARKIMHAQILLKADSSEGGPNWPDEQIHETFGVGIATIERVRKRFVEQGFEDAVNRRPQPPNHEK